MYKESLKLNNKETMPFTNEQNIWTGTSPKIHRWQINT
jgi:hypothetical protein